MVRLLTSSYRGTGCLPMMPAVSVSGCTIPPSEPQRRSPGRLKATMGHPHEDRFPAPVRPLTSPETGPDDATGKTLKCLFGAWEKQAKADGKPAATIRDFRQKVDDLIAFLGHDSIRDMQPADIVRWTDHLRDERRLNGKTIGQKYLAAVRLMFSFAKSRAMGLGDPTEGLRVKAPKRQTTRDRGFTDEEAKRILSAARAGVGLSDRMSDHMRRAIRWVPWVCTHTGARVTEITQLRRSDVLTVDGIPCIRITPEAGSVKTGSHRIVPLHPQMVREGFVRMVDAMPDGPLFHAKGASAKTTSGRIGEWVRDHAKVTDPALQPSHAWRHRLKTLSRDYDIAGEWADHLQGHSNPRAAEVASIMIVFSSAASAARPVMMRVNTPIRLQRFHRL
ncbi:site-specific integrase [Paracoccus sp. 22332]|uniref:site-specific integrase n=1 Tax=Paracoccus sp. 22332 TaxID=3453913 RepID=UPI003F8598DC